MKQIGDFFEVIWMLICLVVALPFAALAYMIRTVMNVTTKAWEAAK